ncbi:MAG: outer membrane protein assembly factor BamB family protein [Fervidobacterium sp.]|uniref:outer membrane protein assembly factor BamB family protein n=1 Tax=Fervidobacterium sp. TaxID=1871331 RepID=UPI0040499491
MKVPAKPRKSLKERRKRLANYSFLNTSIGIVLLSLSNLIINVNLSALVGTFFIFLGAFQILFVRGYRILSLLYLLSAIFLLSAKVLPSYWLFFALFYLPMALAYHRLYRITAQSEVSFLRNMTVLFAILTPTFHFINSQGLIMLLLLIHTVANVWAFSGLRYVDFSFFDRTSGKVAIVNGRGKGGMRSDDEMYKSPVRILWTRSDIYSKPVVLGDSICVTSTDGYLYNFSKDGELIWSVSFEEDILASPIVDEEGKVYVFTTGGNIYSVNSQGHRKKILRVKSAIVATPELYNERLYIVDYSGELHVVGIDGKELYKVDLKSESESSPVIYDGFIYLTTTEGKLYKITLDGKIVWKFVANGYIHTTPDVSDLGFVVFGSNDKNLYAVGFDSNSLWVFQTQGEILSSPKVDNDRIYFGSRDKNFYCVDSSGRKLWSFTASDEIKSKPCVSKGGYIYFGCDDGMFYALDRNGKLCWYSKLEGGIYAQPTVAEEGEVYVASLDGGVYVFN